MKVRLVALGLLVLAPLASRALAQEQDGETAGAAAALPGDEERVPRRLGPLNLTRDGDAQDPGTIGLGVEIGTGSYALNTLDIWQPGLGELPLVVERDYLSSADYDGPLGRNWDSSLFMRVSDTGTFTTASVYSGRMEEQVYPWASTSGGTDFYTTPAGSFYTLTRTGSGTTSRYTLRAAQGTEYRFEYDVLELGFNWYRISEIVDSNGNRLHFNYAANDLLQTIVDSVGNVTTLSWIVHDPNPGRVASIVAQGGARVNFVYDAGGHLVEVRRPAPDGAPGDVSTYYTYDTSHRLLTIQEPGETVPSLVNAYDASGRVASQQFGGQTQSITMDYSAFPLVKVFDRLGARTDWLADPATGLLLQEIVHDSSHPGVTWTTQFQFDANFHLVREIKPDGETFEWTYEASSDPHRRNNLLRFAHKASPSDPFGHVSTWAYTTDFNKMAWEMGPRANAQTGGVFDATKATLVTYDAAGNMTSVTTPPATTPSGPQVASISWQLDARGRPTRFTGPRGLVREMQYADGAVLRPYPTRVIDDPAGAAVAVDYVYDNVNLVVSQSGSCTCSGGASHADFTYDASRRLRQAQVQVNASTDRVISWDHDARGRTIAQHTQDDSPAGDGWSVRSWLLDSLDHVLAETQDIDAVRAATTLSTYDAEERLTSLTYPEGERVDFVHDDHDLLVAQRIVGDEADPADDSLTSWTRLPSGRVQRADYPDGTFETYTWDGYGRQSTVTDTLGRVATYTWDEEDHLLSEETRSSTGVLLDRWLFGWDEVGRMVRIDRLAVDAAGAPLAGGDGLLTTTLDYDKSDNVTVVRREDGAKVTRTYDLFDRLVTLRDACTPPNGMDFDYWTAGPLRRLWEVEGDPATGLSPRRLLAEFASYDLVGRPLEVRDAAGNSNLMGWTLTGGPSFLQNRNGERAEMTYDERGLMLSHRRLTKPMAGPQPEDPLYEYGWDDNGRTEKITARNGPQGPDQVTLLRRNAYGTLQSVIWPSGLKDRYEWDTSLRPVKWTDPNGSIIQYAWDAASRLADVTIQRGAGVQGPTFEHFDYDLRDNVTVARNSEFEVTRGYGSLGVAEVETILDLVAGGARTTRSRLDGVGRLVRLEYPAHTVAVPDATVMSWDLGDRLTSVQRLEGASTRTVASYQYIGSRVTRRTGATLDMLATWDGLGQPTSIEHRKTASGLRVARFDMQHDPTGQTTGVLRTFYNAAGQPLPESASGGLGGGLLNVYDNIRHLVSTAGGLSAADWAAGLFGLAAERSELQYDRNENRTLVSTNFGGPLWQLTNYAIGLINQYVTVGGSPATYDANGNLLAMPAGPDFQAFDYADHPLSWTNAGVTTSARYDAFGRRITTASSGQAERLSYFDDYAVEQLVAGLAAPVREFTYGGDLDEVLELRDQAASTPYSVASDNLGSPVALLSPAGTVMESYRYSTFGLRRAASPTTGALLPGASSPLANPVSFAGRWSIGGSDQLLDFRARTYLPDWGRFAEQDPLGYPDGRLNRYQFSGNNPYRKDNFGLHDDGELTDPPGKNTHVGITKQAGIESGMNEHDYDRAARFNHKQDNSDNTAWGGAPWSTWRIGNHFKWHALGRSEAEQWGRLTDLLAAAEGVGTGTCSIEMLGYTLHYAQDMIAHRTLSGEIFDETWGHGPDSVLSKIGAGFDPDGPEDPTGNEIVTHKWGSNTSRNADFQVITYQAPRNPEGYERHLRKLRAIQRSKNIMNAFMSRCGPANNFWGYFPRYSGGKPIKGPTTPDPRSNPRTGERGKPKGPTTPGPSGGGGGGPTTPPSTGGPSTPGPSTPGPSGPATGGPSGPSGPTTPNNGPTTLNPLGPSTGGGGGGGGGKKPKGPKKPKKKPKPPVTPGPTTPGGGTTGGGSGGTDAGGDGGGKGGGEMSCTYDELRQLAPALI